MNNLSSMSAHEEAKTLKDRPHTPGPWKAGPQGLFVVSPTHRICTLYGNEDVLTIENREANAHLIAAAPKLLEACKMIQDEMNALRREKPNMPGSQMKRLGLRFDWSVVDAAIAKAEGRLSAQ